jgi:hypothetical protein
MNADADSPTDTPSAEPQADAEAALSAKMAALARRNTGRRRSGARPGSPAFVQRLLDGIDALRRHPLLTRYSKELRAELKDVGIENTPTALFDIAVRTRAVMEMTDSIAFADVSGPVNRRKRRLWELTQQRHDLVAAWMQIRLKLGLDGETVLRPQSFSDSFAALMLEQDEGGVDFAATMPREAAQTPATPPALALAAPVDSAAPAPSDEPTAPLPEPPTALELIPEPPAEPEAPAVEDLGNVRQPYKPEPAPPRPRERDWAAVAAGERARGAFIGGEWMPHPNMVDR